MQNNPPTNQLSSEMGEIQRKAKDFDFLFYRLARNLYPQLMYLLHLTERALEDYPELATSPHAYTLNEIRTAVFSMNQVLQQMEECMRLCRQEISMEAVDVEQLVQSIIQNDPELQLPKADIRMEGTLFPVRAHPPFLKSCIVYLLKAACRFVDPGIQPQIRIASDAKGSQVRLWLGTNAINKPKFPCGSYYIPFTPDAFPDIEGVNIGTIHNLMHRMDGEVETTTESDQSLRFWLHLPRAENK